MTASLERRKEVLALAREHDFLILEDDPYFYLYYGKAPRYPSYFSLELEEPETGRVLRFDSLSKILSAGIRIGFATGPTQLLQAINQHANGDLKSPDLNAHTKKVSDFYRSRRDVFQQAMEKHLSGLAAWTIPEAGMFFWFKLLLDDDPSVEGDSHAVISVKAVERGVLALPGTVFLPNGRKTGYVRASFSLLDDAAIDESLNRLGKVVQDARAS
ncbi:hypothetical protein DXG03_009017 [Asterophora parasitica]|uniref:Aminotransferase class I/classII large domain-containing protein n=1 Tax=Asterophora parasitica TaxID=117018 RepID=A0A9P7KDT8_9AGAR|nr:hypothetical protein DXG03_009017 [Asterophora parasitica]